jgi:hypothetical protein
LDAADFSQLERLPEGYANVRHTAVLDPVGGMTGRRAETADPITWNILAETPGLLDVLVLDKTIIGIMLAHIALILAVVRSEAIRKLQLGGRAAWSSASNRRT